MSSVTLASRTSFAGLALTACVLGAASARSDTAAEAFGRVGDEAVQIYTLNNIHGIEARIMTYGATIVSLRTPDRDGRLQNIVLGFDNVEAYAAGVPYYGATVGRYANRIAHGRFIIDGKNYQLSLNNGPNSLHGGTRGFDKRIWQAEAAGATSHHLVLSYVSEAGEEGYPGTLTAHVSYDLDDNDTLRIEYAATTTSPTVVNLANHAYFNLSGDPGRSILDHTLVLNAERFTPVDATLIPTGELRSVAGTPFDFRRATPIGNRIEADDTQLKLGHGYDHNWVLDNARGRAKLILAAVLTDPGSGRVLEIRTTQPGVQFYSGNFMNGKPPGQGSGYRYRTGLCLETQHFPDSPNQAAFPNTILRPGETYVEKTAWHFATLKPAR
ncbi:MAG TPA: aldose epimerase family protein [Steroidobacteraceae bacterium]